MISRGPRGPIESHLFDLVDVTQKLLDHLSHVDNVHHVGEAGGLGRVYSKLVGQGQCVGGIDGHLGVWGGKGTV